MDIELARTFLEVVSTGTFVRAAERLHVTQTAISARIQALETHLGRQVFVRNKAGARLTPAGQEFLQYAVQLVQVWERARQQVAVPPGREAVLSFGGEFNLWNSLLLDWLIWLHRDRPSIVLRTQVDTADRLMDRVHTGALDIAIVYAPYHRPNVEIEPVMEEELIAVTTNPDGESLASENYVYVDWGPDFMTHHNTAFPELREAGRFIGLGPLALRYVLEVGGAGYFRTRAVQGYLADKQLFRVKDAPAFSYSIYAAYSTKSNAKLIRWARDGLAATAAHPITNWPL
jgi:DNA-binding transcriptional LysR family regulator